MDVPKVLAAGLSVSRIAFGTGYLLRPEQARTSWLGRVAKKPAAQVIVRAQGARDVALTAHCHDPAQPRLSVRKVIE